MTVIATFPELRAHCESRLNQFTDCDLTWVDKHYDPPPAAADGAAPAAWVRADLRFFESDTATLDGDTVDIRGELQLSVYTEKRGGDMRVFELLESFWTLFVPNGSDAENLNFWAPMPGESLVFGDPASWYGRRIFITFTWMRG